MANYEVFSGLFCLFAGNVPPCVHLLRTLFFHVVTVRCHFLKMYTIITNSLQGAKSVKEVFKIGVLVVVVVMHVCVLTCPLVDRAILLSFRSW